MIYTEAWCQHLREDPPPCPPSPHVCPTCSEPLLGAGARIWLENPIALLCSPLPALRTPSAPQKSSGGGRPPPSSRKDSPSSYSWDSPSPLPLALPSWTRGLLFAPLTWPLSQALTSRVCPLFSQPDDRPHPSTPGCWQSQQPCIPPLTPPAPLVLGFNSASHPLAR